MAVERIKEYSDTPQESEWNIRNEMVSQEWPEKGHIEFHNFSVRYRDGLDLVLKKLTFSVTEGEKVSELLTERGEILADSPDLSRSIGWNCWPYWCRKIFADIESVPYRGIGRR